MEAARNQERTDDGADAEARRQQTEAAGAELELVARDDGQESEQRARAEREAHVVNDERPHSRGVPRVAKAALDAGEDAFRASRGSARGGLFHPRIATIITMKRTRAREQRAARAEPCDRRAGERRTDCARDVEGDRAERDRARHVGARDEIVDARRAAPACRM